MVTAASYTVGTVQVRFQVLDSLGVDP